MTRLALLMVALAAFSARADDAGWRVPFITTPDEVVERMLELADTRAGDVVMDLGSGDGRIVIAAARRFGARGIGIELDRKLVEASRENARAAGVADRVTFVQGDVLTSNLTQASVVTIYLLPQLMGDLQGRFIDQLRPGTRIVSHSFGMPGWRPDRTQTMRVSGPHPGQGDESTLYLWIVPAEVRGIWKQGSRRVRIDQSYQQIDVEGASRASLSGTTISWESPAGRFQGRVEGSRIVGELVRDGARAPVVLTR